MSLLSVTNRACQMLSARHIDPLLHEYWVSAGRAQPRAVTQEFILWRRHDGSALGFLKDHEGHSPPLSCIRTDQQSGCRGSLPHACSPPWQLRSPQVHPRSQDSYQCPPEVFLLREDKCPDVACPVLFRHL